MKKIKYILISLFIILSVFLTSCIYITNETTSNGKINLYVTIENNVVVFDQEVEFYKGEYLIDVLNRHLDVELGSGSTEGMIMAINGCVAPKDFSYYYKLILNCEYASYGACDQILNDGDSIMILYSELSDYSTGC